MVSEEKEKEKRKKEKKKEKKKMEKKKREKKKKKKRKWKRKKKEKKRKKEKASIGAVPAGILKKALTYLLNTHHRKHQHIITFSIGMMTYFSIFISKHNLSELSPLLNNFMIIFRSYYCACSLIHHRSNIVLHKNSLPPPSPPPSSPVL